MKALNLVLMKSGDFSPKDLKAYLKSSNIIIESTFANGKFEQKIVPYSRKQFSRKKAGFHPCQQEAMSRPTRAMQMSCPPRLTGLFL